MADSIMMEYDCPICGDVHRTDSYGWVTSCIGYYSLDEIKNKEQEWMDR